MKELSKLVEFEKEYSINGHPFPDKCRPLKVGFQVNLRNVPEVNEVRVKVRPNATNEKVSYVTVNPKGRRLCGLSQRAQNLHILCQTRIHHGLQRFSDPPCNERQF